VRPDHFASALLLPDCPVGGPPLRYKVEAFIDLAAQGSTLGGAGGLDVI